MNEMDKIAVEKIEELRAERDYYKSVSDTLQERLEDTESAFRALKGQYALLLRDQKVADVG